MFRARCVLGVIVLACLAGGVAAAQESMPDMPGMEHHGMPMPAKPAEQKPAAKRPAAQKPALQKPAEQKPAPMQMPGDLQRPAAGDALAVHATESERKSIEQQKGQVGVKPGAESDRSSVTREVYSLQEQENLARRTGANLPAPELLQDAVARKAMTVEEFLRLAEGNNPTLEQMRQGVVRAEQQARQAGLLPNPTVGYSGEHIRGGEYHGGEQGAYVAQEFVLGGKLGLRRNVYKAQAAENETGVEVQRARVRNDVEQAFYEALAAQAAVVVRQRLLQVTLDAVETVHQLANLGQADAPDILQTEVESEQAKIDYVRAQREYLLAFRQLAALAGSPGLAVAPLAGDLNAPPELDAEARVAEIVAGSPEVRAASQSVVVAEARLKDAKREAVPNLTVRAGEWYSGERVSSGQAAGPMSFADAGVKIPLFNRNQGNAAAARAELERARQEVTRVQLRLRQRSAPLAQHYQAAQFEAERYRTELLPRARRAYELYVMKYQQMAGAYPQVLVSQRTLFQLQLAYLGALEEQWTTAVALRNFTLSGGLEPAMPAGSDDTMMNLPTGGSGGSN